MSLPITNLKTGTVDLGDCGAVAVRELSRYELHKIRECSEDLARAETLTLAFGTGVDEQAADEWLKQTGGDTADKVLTAILVLSGLAGDAVPN